MLIVDKKDNATTQAYLQMLENAFENGKLTSEQLTTLLMQHDIKGVSIGMFIACYKDATTTQAYLRLLENALENEKLTSEQLTTLLTQQDKEGWSIGMFIVDKNDNATIQAYLQMLENALENGKLTSEQFTRILTQQDKDGVFVLRFDASHQDSTLDSTRKAYLRLVESALENEKLTSEQFTRILTQQDKEGWSIGTCIVCCRGPITRQAYLQLLKKAIENEKLTSEQLTTLLAQQDKYGQSIGMLFACYYEDVTTQAYLHLLERASENEKLPSDQLTTLLTQQDKYGKSIGMIFAAVQEAATTQQYLQLLKNALENGKLTSEQLTALLTQQDYINGRSIGMFIAHHQDKTTDQQCQNLIKFILFIQKIEKTSSFLASLDGKAVEKLKNLLLENDIDITDSQKNSLNERVRGLIFDFNSRMSDQQKAEFFELLKNVPDTSLFYILALISQLNFWTLDASSLYTVSLKLNTLSKTSLDYKEGQYALATYYVSLFSQTEKMFTVNELLAFLIYAERCGHAMLDTGYKMLRNYFIEGNTETAQGATSSLGCPEPAPDIILKKVLKSLVLLLSDKPCALKVLEDVLNQHRKDKLLDFYLERTLFNASSGIKNISNFFKCTSPPLFSTNKSREIQITSEQLQELESLIPANQQHNDVKELIAEIINEFNKGSITKENLFKNLRNSINEGNPDYLYVGRAMVSSAPSTS